MINLNELNEKQKEAVVANDNHIIVIAGAGSGKTKVLTTKIAYLIENGIRPENILALTFTNKASKEMRERIAKATKLKEQEINATTFHSFAVKVLRRHIEKLNYGYTKNFKIYDDDDTKKIMSDILEKNNIDVKEYKNYIIARNKYNKDMSVSASLINIIKEFNDKAVKDNSLTFDDLLIMLAKLFEIPEVLKIYQTQFEYILADEYQDTDPLQYSILKNMSKIHNRLFVVGDDSQSIYGFRDADSKIVFRFMKDFPDHKLIKLEQNYRSTPEILSLANQIIKNNKEQIDKNLFTKNDNGMTPSLFRMVNNKEEAFRIATIIKQLKSRNVPYKDIAILYRVNSLSREFEEEFIKQKIPYTIYNGVNFYQREEIKDVVSYLRLIADENDNTAFKRIVNKPRRKVGNKMLAEIEVQANYHQGPFYSCLIESENHDKTKDFYNKIVIARLKYLNKEFKSITDIVDYILDTLSYQEYVVTLKETSFNDRFKNIEELKSIIAEFEMENDENTEPTREDYFNYFLQSLALYTSNDTDNDGEEKDAVKLMTVHASKGLEFPVVFLPALEENIFPSPKARNETDIEEERRLYYVAVTRAKKCLFLTCSEGRIYNGKKMYFNKSRFLYESKGKIIYKEY